MPTHVDLSHPITEGMETYPGLPAPRIATHLSREQAEAAYGPGVTFHVAVVEICTNTGTYLDVPFHRFADGHDLAELPLERVAAVPLLLLDRRGQRAVELTEEDLAGAADSAVLVRTDHARAFGTDRYAQDAPFLTAHSAALLAEAGPALVGIDSINVDDLDDTQRPVHTTLLRAGIPVVEHLTNLWSLPADADARFTAVPPPLADVGTFAVRAFATVDD